MDVELFGDLLEGLNVLERFKSYAGFEFGIESSSFCLHFVCFRLGSAPGPDHHNPGLAPGPIFGVRLASAESDNFKIH